MYCCEELANPLFVSLCSLIFWCPRRRSGPRNNGKFTASQLSSTQLQRRYLKRQPRSFVMKSLFICELWKWVVVVGGGREWVLVGSICGSTKFQHNFKILFLSVLSVYEWKPTHTQTRARDWIRISHFHLMPRVSRRGKMVVRKGGKKQNSRDGVKNK